jgi:hypothetical protein
MAGPVRTPSPADLASTPPPNADRGAPVHAALDGNPTSGEADGEIDPAPGQLVGGPGDDRLQGGSSADTLAGGPGNDRLDGGSVSQGAVVRPDGARDAVDCGTGQDTADPETDALRSCERLLTPLECDDPATCGPLRVRLTTGKTTLLSRRVAVVADDPEFPGGALSLRVPARVARRAAASRRRVVEHLPDVRDNATSPSLYPLTYRFFLRP